MKRAEQRFSTLLASGDTEAYQKALRNYTLDNKRYKDMVDGTTLQLAHVNETALAFSKDQMPEMYAINYNQMAEVYEKVDTDLGGGMKMAGIRFDLVDENTVRRLIMDGDIQLPNQNKRLSIPKDQRWNTKQINSAMLQGIIQGESIDKIAKRLEPIVDNNLKAAIRTARTLCTGAENHGRLDSYKKAEKDGVVMKKVWMATPDGRTRDWHVDLDGQEVGVDEEFIDGVGNALMYPGDPGGAPETVYNCRCTMVSHVIGFVNPETGELTEVDYTPEPTLHDKQMTKEKERRNKEAEEKLLKMLAKDQAKEKSEKKTDNKQPEIKYEGAEEWQRLVDDNNFDKMDEWTDEWLNTISDDERRGVVTYTGSAFMNMNKYLRGLTSENRFPEAIENCKAALDKASLPERTIVTRGSDWGSLQGMFGNNSKAMREILDGNYKNVVGAVIGDKGFFSTTPTFSGGFTGEVRYVIEVPKGSHAMYIDSISRYQGEYELLLQCDSKFVIHEIQEGWDSEIAVYMSLI